MDWNERLYFGRGNPETDLPAFLSQACQKAEDHRFGCYPNPLGEEEFRQAVSAALSRWSYPTFCAEDEIIATAGATPAIFSITLALGDSADLLLLPNPGWPGYVRISRALGFKRKTLFYSLPEKHESGRGWSNRLKVLIAGKRTVMIINSPHNPTGLLLSPDHLDSLAELCDSIQTLTVISDEADHQTVHPGIQHVSAASISGLGNRTITVHTLSKGYMLPGLRVGYMFGHRNLLEKVRTAHLSLGTYPSWLSQHIGRVALDQGDAYVEGICRRIHDARDSLRLSICQNTALSCEETDGTYYLFPNISSTRLPDDLFCLGMQEEAGVEVLPGSAFGSGGRGHIRLYLVRPKQQIEELGRRLQVFIDSRP